MKRYIPAVTLALLLSALPCMAQRKSCEDLKTEIAAKLDAKGVKNYMLNIVNSAEIKDEKVVGNCDGGTKRITYTKN